MKSPDVYKEHLVSAGDIRPDEREIITEYIVHRDTINKTAIKTRIRQAAICIWIMRQLHKAGVGFEDVTVHDMLTVINATNAFTKGSRQTYVFTVKNFTQYLHRFHHPIKDLDLLNDVKSGSPQRNRKIALTMEEWDRVFNLPMSARNRAILAVMYDGYHRPGEVLVLKWSDLKETEEGIEYTITFKTEIPRTISQQEEVTKILETWRREAGAVAGSDALIFPDLHGMPYESNMVLVHLFNRLKKETGITKLKPSTVRTTAITHDVDAGRPIIYICLKAWGVSYNPMINIYVRADSARIQRDQHKKDGIKMGESVLGKSGKFSTKDNVIEELKKLREEHENLKRRLELVEEMGK